MYGGLIAAQVGSARLVASTGLTPTASTATRTSWAWSTGSASCSSFIASGPPGLRTTRARISSGWRRSDWTHRRPGNHRRGSDKQARDGVACGSLGVLTAVAAEQLGGALERVYTGDWTRHRLPALAIHPRSGPDQWAVTDFVTVRHGAGQLVANVSVDDELYVRLAGDGLIVATALG